MSAALVTGSSGFLGRRFAAALAAAGWDVACCDVADPVRPDDCMDYFREVSRVAFDLVVHAAAAGAHRAAIDGVPTAAVYNQMLDAALFDWAARTGQRRVLYLSSCAAYPVYLQDGTFGERRFRETDMPTVWRDGLTHTGVPPDGYGWAKLCGERAAHDAGRAGLAVTVVRPFSGYGGDQSEDFPFGAFLARARRREDPFDVWGSGRQVRDWVHADDVVAACLALAEAGVTGPVNVCTGVGTAVGALARMVCEAAGYSPAFRFDRAAPAGMPWRVGDPTRLRKVYTPRVSLAEGVARAVAAGHAEAV